MVNRSDAFLIKEEEISVRDKSVVGETSKYSSEPIKENCSMMLLMNKKSFKNMSLWGFNSRMVKKLNYPI